MSASQQMKAPQNPQNATPKRFPVSAAVNRGLFRGQADGRAKRCPNHPFPNHNKNRVCNYCKTLPYVELPLHKSTIFHDAADRHQKYLPGALSSGTTYRSTLGSQHNPSVNHNVTPPSKLEQLPLERALVEKLARAYGKNASPPNNENEGMDNESDQSAHAKPRGWERIGRRVRNMM